MKVFKAKMSTAPMPSPVWCYHCRIRIAPYDMKTVFHGKDYHRDCFAKVSHANGRPDRRH